MASLRDDLAAHIRHVDGKNELSPYQLGSAIADFLTARGVVTPIVAGQVEDFAEQQNQGAGYMHPKPVGPDALAAAVVDHFKLEEN